MNVSRSAMYACLLASASLLPGCDWVDSVGSNSDNQLPNVRLTSDGVLADAPLPGDVNNQPLDDQPLDDASLSSAELLTLVVLEEAAVSVSATAQDVDGVVQSLSWNEVPVAEGAFDACADVDGFDLERAAATLEAACSVSGCAPAFDTVSTSNAMGEVAPEPVDDSAIDAVAAEAGGELLSAFEITLPALRSPVGVTYELIATDDRGGAVATPVTFCGVSINEAPEAVDDSFSVLEGSVLEVSSDTLNLLSNDSDDIDSSNDALRVLPDPVSPPVAASVFELRDDGGFTYAFTGANLTSDIVDSFEYAITDGSFTSTATATVRIVERDDPPELDEELPALEAIEGVAFDFDLAPFFSDPEGADLGFDILDGDLPSSGDLLLSPIGVLAGIPAAGDAGDYALVVSASDGTLNAEADLALSVLENERVEAVAIPDQSVRAGQRIRFGVARYFSDPEGVSLEYRLAANGTALNLTIDTQSGVITGFVSDAGTYALNVTASDGFSRPVTGNLELVVTE